MDDKDVAVLTVFPILKPLLPPEYFLLLLLFVLFSERLMLGVRENEGTLLNDGEFCERRSLLLLILVSVSCWYPLIGVLW